MTYIIIIALKLWTIDLKRSPLRTRGGIRNPPNISFPPQELMRNRWETKENDLPQPFLRVLIRSQQAKYDFSSLEHQDKTKKRGGNKTHHQ